MGKSILVIDTPKGCYYCPFHRYPVFCSIKGKCVMKNMLDDSGVSDFDTQFPTWCPLKEIPGKKEEYNRLFSEEYAKGWNDCIDKILKERN